LDFYVGCGNGLRRKLENRCILTFKHVSQQHGLPVWKLQGIMMGSRVVLVNLPKDCGPVIEHLRHPAEQPAAYTAPYRSGEGKLCSRKNTNCSVDIFRSSEPARARIEVTNSQFLANFGGT
jgi:hypothetical protein